MRIAAIVVTFNRKELLLEALESIINQTRPVDAIYLIDNCSSDGTEELLREYGYLDRQIPPELRTQVWEDFKIITSKNDFKIAFNYVRMNKNVGGSGGFYEGLKRAYQDGYYWFWLMDDDTIPKEDSLEKLLEKIKIVNPDNFGFACSKVLWIDGTIHKMNVPSISTMTNGVPFNYYEDKKVLVVESASFVSLLTNRQVVKKIGLPLKEFFIWVDDVEYTFRITKNKMLGLYVSDSVVIHKTASNYSSKGVYDWRFYYYTRNWLWFKRLHRKKTRYFYELIRTIFSTYKIPKRYKLVNLKACLDSLFKLPKVEFPED